MDSIPDGASILIVDILHFKERVNDPHGNDLGDAVLRTLGDRLRTELAPRRVFRAGGDEFAVEVVEGLDSDTGLDLALQVAGIIRRPVNGLADPLEPRIGVSTLRVQDRAVFEVWISAEYAADLAALEDQLVRITDVRAGER